VAQGSTQWQTITIPLSNFSGFDRTAPFGNLGLRFWFSSSKTIDVDDLSSLAERMQDW